MTATCSTCGWSGSALKVVDGGRCPECGESIRYDSKPLQSAPKLTIEEFNRRAAKALRSVADENPFLAAVLPICEDGMRLTLAQQNGLYRTVLRFADQITDRAVVDFATMNARGAD